MAPLWWQSGRCTGDDGPKGCQEGTQGDAGLWSLVALSPEGQGVPPTHPCPNTCKKSHVSPGSCPPSGVGAGGLPPAMALSASTQSCSRGPTALKSPAKGGGCPAPRLQAQQGELRQVPGGTRPLGSATPCPVHPWWHLDGPGHPGGHVHLPPHVPWLQEEQDSSALGCPQKATSVPTSVLPPNPVAPCAPWPTMPYLGGGLWGPSAVGLGWPPATAGPVWTRRGQEGQEVGEPHGGARAGCWYPGHRHSRD